MLRTLQQIHESFVKSGGRIHLLGIAQVSLNIFFTILASICILSLGEWNATNDYVDLMIEGGSVTMIFMIFFLVAFVPLKQHIKQALLLGLLLMQSGRLVDALDELVEFSSAFWHQIGDLTFLIGSIVTVYGSALWVMFTYRMSTEDKLTGVYNRRFFETMLEHYLKRRRHSDEGGCLLSLDIDNFKQVNDQYGHAVGDKVLKIVGDVLLNGARREDSVCRSGGEEFEILLAGVTEQQANAIATRILTQLAAKTPESVPTVTASIGIARILTTDSMDSLRNRADQAMYQAKRDGKAQVRLAG